MGFGDKFKDLAKQAQDAVAERKEQITEVVERASVAADQRTGGKYTEKIAKVGQKAEQAVEKVGGDRDGGGEPPASSTATASEPTGTSSEPTGTASEPAGTSSEPTGTSSEPTGTASEPTGTASEPTEPTVAEAPVPTAAPPADDGGFPAFE